MSTGASLVGGRPQRRGGSSWVLVVGAGQQGGRCRWWAVGGGLGGDGARCGCQALHSKLHSMHA